MNRVHLDFGDWGSNGRIAILLAPLTWRHIIVPAGFMTDGASVPRPLWWLLPPWGDEATPAAIIHDFICDALDRGQPVDDGHSRKDCDRLFREALIDLGIVRWRAWICWMGVRLYSLVYA